MMMMSSDRNKDENSSSRILTTRPPAALNCPRCDSPNTKFCYYNNYSLTQPRHFCKACKRYWTKGGALRNVPVGGGCRKNKKTARASSSRLSDSVGASSYSDTGGFRFFNDLEFQLGGGGLTNIPRFNNIISTTLAPVGNQFVSSFGDIPTVLPLSSSGISTNFGNLDPNSGNNPSQFMAFNNFPLTASSSASSSSHVLKQDHADKFGGGLLHDSGMGPANSNLASSIESLSSINQDLHWKLQQDRFNTMFDGTGDNNNNNYQRQNEMISSTANYLETKIQTHDKPHPILFQNLEISSKPADHDSRIENTGNISAANLASEWCFGNSSNYAPVVSQIPANSSGNGNSKEIQAWANFDQYTTLP